jgi:hypothetical protein
MMRSLAARLARLEAARRQVATVLLVAADKADAERLMRAHELSGDKRNLIVVTTGVPRGPIDPP